MTIQIENLIKQSTQELTANFIETTTYEIRLLLGAVLGCEAGEVLSYQQELTPEQLQKFAQFIELRRQRVPADKIIGRRGFYKYDFVVSENVLSPRADTEVLVEAASHDIKNSSCSKVLELGVGSGCIILSLLADCPKLEGIGIDISDKALAIAEKNASLLGVASRVSFRQGDWFLPNFAEQFSETFDVIVSNPPYISKSEIETLEPEVRMYDPRLALDGGEDGLDSYRRLAELAPVLLSKGGRIYLEVGETQAEDVANIFTKQGLSLVSILADLSGIKRCVILKK